jgi:Mg-chelatase subunit ChlD/tetratricopeptide (TPR) repeat protein
MTYVRRLKAVGAILALAAVFTNSHVWGESAKKAPEKRRTATPKIKPDKAEQDIAEDLANTKFARANVLTYRTTGGDTLFALQIKPKLEPVPERPRDYLVMIDTSASQVKAPLATALALTEGLRAALKGDDRIAIWTVNTPAATRDLTRGFRSGKSQQVQEALAALKQEVPLGDTDLKEGLKKAIACFERNRDRQQVILFLGDGMSVHNPITAAERFQLAQDMVKNAIGFYPVPLGPRLDPTNLHGLATGTGGSVVRLQASNPVTDTLKQLREAMAAPVLYPQRAQFGAEVAEAVPTVLPPLRGDAPTLVVGRLKSGQTITYSVEGTVASRDARIQGSEAIPDSEPDNFFLVSMLEQWQHSKDQPALNRADRTLAYAYQQGQLARAGLLDQAEWAVGQNKLEAAQNLFQQIKKLDPHDIEADAGLKWVQQLRAGTVKKDQLKPQLGSDVKHDARALAQAEEKLPAARTEAPPPGEDLLQEQRRRLAVEEQRVTQMVDDAQREARQLLPTDPDAAHELLKRIYTTVRDNPDITARTRDLLSNRLESALRNVDIQGARIKRDRDEQLRQLADASRRFEIVETRAAEQERTRRRMEAFSRLMNQARYEDAYLQALAIQQDAVSAGRPVPTAATAGYDIALNANNLSQVQELRRVREERFLLTMMQVERSHVPFPDEPPIQFPPAPVWRELTKLRKEKYESSGLTEDDPATLQQIRIMKNKLARPVTLDKGIEANTPLREALEFISDRYDVTVLVDTQAFKAEGNDTVEETPVKLPKMNGVSLATVLRLLTAQANGTYLVRRDYIEVTTGRRAVTEKVVRVYPVADLVIPIPNAFNARAVNQTLTILGTAPGLGLQIGGPQALGGLGAFGAVGLGGALGIGGLGALGLGGALGGALGLAGGALGLAGGQALGFAGGGLAGGGGGFGGGGLGFGGGGQVNLGVGGGALGFGGGAIGQLGNLGGQFGLQGGDQSAVLVQLIRETVGQPREWSRPGMLIGGQQPRGGINAPEQDEGQEQLTPEMLNSLGYYPPSRALVVKGTSRIHTNLGGGLLSPQGGPPGPMGALNRQGDVLVIRPRDNARDKLNERANGPPKEQVAAAKDRPGDKAAGAGTKLKDLPTGKPDSPEKKYDPEKIWQAALAKGVDDPGLIIAVADFLAEQKRFDHLREFLKANLRLGIVVRPWVYDALAMALEASGGSPDDIERARVSAVDLEPTDAHGFVRASKVLAEQKRYDRAVAFCRQAALLEPNSPNPYEEALMYADLSKDTDAMEWAAGTLLRQDWPADNRELHQKAGSKLRDFAQTLERSNRKADAERILQAVSHFNDRDLIVELNWQGEADLDLEVKEPIGTLCSFMQRQTPGGGILLGDNLDNLSRETYVAAKAFPGDYQVTIRRIWGRPLGGKATLEIIQHQGTSRETKRRETIVFDRKHTLSFSLDDGRRTTAEYVPPPAANKRTKIATEPSSSDRVLNKLRAKADPEFTGGDATGMRAKLASLGVPLPTRQTRTLERSAPEQVVYQTRVTPQIPNSADLTAQLTVVPEQGSFLKLTPVFQTVSKAQAMPALTNPLIPGAYDASGGR